MIRFSTIRRLALSGLVSLLTIGFARAAQDGSVQWPSYGGDAGGRRYSAAAQINPSNIDALRRQWVFRTGDLERRSAPLMKRSKFENTPILVDDRLVTCTPFNEVIALDPGDGRLLWRHDPQVPVDLRPANRFNCRGVTQWRDPAQSAGARCATRIFMGTNDARLIALDARDGARCTDFGTNGEVHVDTGTLSWPGEFQITSPPVVSQGVVVVGSAINDNGRSDAPAGTVRAFDAVSGTPRWSWNPIRAALDGTRPAAGGANVWAPMALDEARGLVYLPTSSPSPDFYGGARPGPNRDADSVVALRIADGSRAWAFQVVNHDVWDYDLPAQPTLARIRVGDRDRDVVIQATKQGLVFVLDRDSGEPVLPVESRPVPGNGAPGEMLATTQLFPADLPALVPSHLKPEDAYGFSFFDRHACRDRIAALRGEGLYTPPSTQGTIVFPATGGGVNWGGVAIDPDDVVYVNTSRMAHALTLIPREEFERAKADAKGRETSAQDGAPFGMRRELIASPFGAPCNPTPWGTLAALDLRSRRILWGIASGHDRGHVAARHRAGHGHAEFRRPGRDGWRTHLHRRGNGSLSACI